MQNPDTQHCRWKNTTRNNRHPAKQLEITKRIVAVITVVPKEASVPFGFNCWQSSLPSLEQILITGNSFVFHNAKIKITIVTLITSYTNLATVKLVDIPLFKLLSILHLHSWYSDLTLRLRGPWVFDVIISFVFLWIPDQPIPKTLSVTF